MKTQLFCALDFDNAEAARALYKQIRPFHKYFKIGLELFTHAGPDFVRELSEDGAEIFLDLKFHDIPNTVAGAIRQTAGLGAGWLNVHLSGGRPMVEAAREALEKSAPKGRPRPKLLGVTVLTSMDEETLRETNVHATPAEQVLKLAKLGFDAGADGIVCSPQELVAVRQNFPREFLTVVPGIRPAMISAADSPIKDDQFRIATPESAARDGADFIVVGRPIYAAKDPVAAVKAILGSI